jgi:D-inositol-3-phosphate glycosyltransferase
VVIGSYLPQSGFTRVLLTVLSRLSAGYDVHFVGMGYKGPPIVRGQLTIHPTNLQGGDGFGAYQGAALVMALRAPLVVWMNDLWMLKNYLPAFAPLGARVKRVIYCPLDGRLPDASLVAPLVSVDRCVVYTSFAAAEIQRACAALAASGVTPAFAAPDIIPHGVDRGTFHPIDGGRLAARAALFPDRDDLREAFIVLNANRPIARKRIDLTIAAFAHFARNLPADANVWLYLHHAIITPDERDRVLAWAREQEVLDRLILDTTPASDAQLNLIYNACDVGVNTAMGEGWGLVSLEHAATGAAQIVPRHSACAEIWGDGGVLIDPVSSGVPAFSPLDMATVSPIDVAHALDRLYAEGAYRQEMSAAAIRIAARPDYGWDAIADRWAALLQETIASAGRGEAA